MSALRPRETSLCIMFGDWNFACDPKDRFHKQDASWTGESNAAERDQWVELMPVIFYFHRSFSWVILALAGWLFWRAYKSALGPTVVGRILKGLVGLVIFEMLLGGALNHLGFPLVAQPVHLLAAHLIFGAIWFLWATLSVASLQPSRKPYV